MYEVIIVGSGISGLMSAVKLAQSGMHVTMLSYFESMRSASCMAQGGINAAEPYLKDSPRIHFEETITGGGWLADQQAVMGMCEFAPKLISMYDHMGVAFNRRDDGLPDTRYFGGMKYPRTHYSDTTTGLQLLSALDGQASRLEEQGLLKRISGRDFVSALIDDNECCCGCIVQDIHTMKLEAYKGRALIIATGSYAGLYGWSTTAALSNGAVVGQLMRQGIPIANPEFVQFHPTAMAEGDKPRLISESARGEGGRIWTLRNGKRWNFLEEMYPDFGNLVTRDEASRAIYKVVMEMGHGIDGKRQVNLDIASLSDEIRQHKLSNVIDIYKKFSGEDPEKVPMHVFPAPHYSMGGILVDKHHRTRIKGLYACGECDYLYHGANRLGGNSLLSATYSGYICADTILEDKEGQNQPKPCSSGDDGWISKEINLWENEMNGYYRRSGNENAPQLTIELGELLTVNAGIIRNNALLAEALEKAMGMMERWQRVLVNDNGSWANASVLAVRKLRSCIVLAEAVIKGALERNESRGAHYKPEFPGRDDGNWLKTTVARFEDEEITLQYQAVDTSILSPLKGREEAVNT